MYFNVYTDTGGTVEGYLIPDGFSAKPRILVRCEEEQIGPIACDIFLSGPYEHKHHETGVVGFLLNEANVPGIAEAQNFEIADADSGFVIYRRLLPDRHIQKRIFRLETQFAPHQELDRSVKPYFQFHAVGAEKYGSETLRQMLEISHQPSTYVSGRVMLKSAQGYLTHDTLRITSLRDPFYELALRLWSVSAFSRRKLSFVSERDEILFRPAMDFFADTNFSNSDDLVKKIRSASKEVLTLFESPFTHQLVASSPSDKISRDAVSSALDILSQFSVLDVDERDARLATDLAELLEIDGNTLSFAPVRSPFLELSHTLRELKILEQVLETDLILFYFIKKAEKRAMQKNL